MSNYPKNTENVIDSRDIIGRIKKLKKEIKLEREKWFAKHEGSQDAENTTLEELENQFLETVFEEIEELNELENLANKASQYSTEWKSGTTLINDDYFQTYAEQLAEEIGAINDNAGWPLNHINWEAAAEELKADYSSVDFAGTTFWIRNT